MPIATGDLIGTFPRARAEQLPREVVGAGLGDANGGSAGDAGNGSAGCR